MYRLFKLYGHLFIVYMQIQWDFIQNYLITMNFIGQVWQGFQGPVVIEGTQNIECALSSQPSQSISCFNISSYKILIII